MEEHLATIQRAAVILESFNGNCLNVVDCYARVLREPVLGNLDELDYGNNLPRFAFVHCGQSRGKVPRSDNATPRITALPRNSISIADFERGQDLKFGAIFESHFDGHLPNFHLCIWQSVTNCSCKVRDQLLRVGINGGVAAYYSQEVYVADSIHVGVFDD